MKSDNELEGLVQSQLTLELCLRVGETNRLLSLLVGEKQYICKECGEKFDTALALARHTKTHKKEGDTPA